MSITVAEPLAEPQLGLSLLAGEYGLQQRITWAHISDLPRLWEWVTGGGIMMTNGLSIPADPAGQVRLAESSLLQESRRLRQTARIYDLLRLAGPRDQQWDVPTHHNALLLVLPLSEPHPDAVVLLHAASVLGLELSRTMLALEDQRRLGAEFLAQALEGRFALADLDSRLKSFQLPAEKFLIVSISGLDELSFATIHAELWRHGLAHVSLRQSNTLHLVLPSECTEDQLRHALPDHARIGMSRPASAAGMQRALQESLWALGAAGSTGQTLVRYGDGPSWLGLTSMEEGQAMVQRLLGPILDYERGKQPDLLKTLKTYLDHQRSWQKTAAALFTHRQTVIYRVRKIGELTGLDMAETSSLAQLWFALQIHQAMDLQHHAVDRPD